MPRGFGRRNSLPRRLILEFLEQNREKHFSAKELYKSLLSRGINIGIASVYRNLEFLSSNSIIKKYNFAQEAKYQFVANKTHHHIVLNGVMEDIELSTKLKDSLKEFIEALETKRNIQVIEYDIIFRARGKKYDE